MGNDWDIGLLNCFGNCGVCIITYLLPCITYGQVYDGSGQGSFLVGMICAFIPILDFFCLAKARQQTREKHNISGGFCGDLLASFFCPCCVLIQAKHQLDQSNMGMDMERV